MKSDERLTATMSEITLQNRRYVKSVFEEFTGKLLKALPALYDANLNVSNISGTIGEGVRWCDLDELTELEQFTYKIETTDGIVISYDICDYVELGVFHVGNTNLVSYNIYRDRCVKSKKYFHVELSPKP